MNRLLTLYASVAKSPSVLCLPVLDVPDFIECHAEELRLKLPSAPSHWKWTCGPKDHQAGSQNH